MATECFYHAAFLSSDFRLLKSMHCDHGCCGTTEEQRCCTEDERYRTYDHGKVWRFVAIAFSILAAILLLCIFIYCLFKKKNKKTVRVSDGTGRQTRGGDLNQRPLRNYADLFTLTQTEEIYPYPKPPPYSPTIPDYNEQASQDDTSITNTQTSTHGHDETSFITRGGHSRNKYPDDQRHLPPPYTVFDSIR